MRKILLLLAAMALLLSCSDETTYVEYDADPVMVESYKELSNLDASNYLSKVPMTMKSPPVLKKVR